MKKICLIINSLSPNGAERAMVNLAYELVDRGYEVHIIVLEHVKYFFTIKNPNIHIHLLEISPCPLWIRCLDKIMKIFKIFTWWDRIVEGKTISTLNQLIAKHGPFALTISNLPLADDLSILAKIPRHYCFIHRDIEGETELLYRQNHNSDGLYASLIIILWKVKRKLRYKGQNMIFLNEEMKKGAMAMGIIPKSSRIIYNIIDIDKIRRQALEYEPEDKDYVIYVGRIAFEKRPVFLLKAYIKSGIKQKLIYIGKGPVYSKIKQAVQDHGVQDRVLLVGQIKNPYPYIKNARALILASSLEGLPTVLIEALALGTPVVSTSCPTGPKEILTDELAEFLSPVGDLDSLAKNIAKVVKSPPKIQDKHVAKFNKEINMSKYLKLIEEADKS